MCFPKGIMKEVSATLKLEGIKVEVCSLKFDVNNDLTNDQIDMLVHQKFSERLIVDVVVKEKE